MPESGNFFPSRFSPSLHDNVALSEFWERPAPSSAELTKRNNAAILPAGGLQQQLDRMHAAWLTYDHDEFYGKCIPCASPVLSWLSDT